MDRQHHDPDPRPGAAPDSPAGGRDAARTRRALLDAATQEFTEHGYAATTARRIAARAGVNQSLVFRYFGSKRNLYQQSLMRGGAERDTAEEADTPHGKAVLLAVLRRFMQPAGRGEVHPVLAMLRSVSTPEGAQAMREQMRDTYLPAVQALIARNHPDWSQQQCAIRAELAWAWILGIGVVRAVVGLPAVSASSADDVEGVVDEVLAQLLAGSVDADEIDP